ncbi:hypothetical protein VTI74DRAFT_1182 [Chaetomium olivicolor]
MTTKWTRPMMSASQTAACSKEEMRSNLPGGRQYGRGSAEAWRAVGNRRLVGASDDRSHRREEEVVSTEHIRRPFLKPGMKPLEDRNMRFARAPRKDEPGSLIRCCPVRGGWQVSLAWCFSTKEFGSGVRRTVIDRKLLHWARTLVSEAGSDTERWRGSASSRRARSVGQEGRHLWEAN